MFQGVGWAREKLGKSVNKVILLRNVGKYKTEEGQEIVKYRVILQRFFGLNDRFFEFDGHAYELRLENEAYGRAETHVQFLDYDTGDSLNMTGKTLSRKEPLTLGQLLSLNHVKTFAAQLKGSNFMLVWFVIGLAVGGMLGYIITQNLPGIVGAVRGG